MEERSAESDLNSVAKQLADTVARIRLFAPQPICQGAVEVSDWLAGYNRQLTSFRPEGKGMVRDEATRMAARTELERKADHVIDLMRNDLGIVG